MFLKDRGVVGSGSRVERFDEPMNSGCHHEEVASGLGARVPVRVWRPARNEQRFARPDLAILIADTESEASVEHDPCLVVRPMQMHRRDRSTREFT